MPPNKYGARLERAMFVADWLTMILNVQMAIFSFNAIFASFSFMFYFEMYCLLSCTTAFVGNKMHALSTC